jgi:hypothetical protein
MYLRMRTNLRLIKMTPVLQKKNRLKARNTPEVMLPVLLIRLLGKLLNNLVKVGPVNLIEDEAKNDVTDIVED